MEELHGHDCSPVFVGACRKQHEQNSTYWAFPVRTRIAQLVVPHLFVAHIR
jgi:hypothetical protein